MQDLRNYQQIELRLATDLEKLRGLAHRYGVFPTEAERAQGLLLEAGSGPTALGEALSLATALAPQMRLHLQQRVNDWQRRYALLQQSQSEAAEPSWSSFSLEPLRHFLEQDDSWKRPIREVMESWDQDLPDLLGVTETRGSLLASIKTSLDSKARERISRDLFHRLCEALEEGLKAYELELLLRLDRLWDDFLDHHPDRGAGTGPVDLQRNREWAQSVLSDLRQRLVLTYHGGFNSWLQRPDLWIRLPQNLPVREIRADVEAELIRQLGIDLSPLHGGWLERIQRAFSPPPLHSTMRGDADPRTGESVALESEQAELRDHWNQLHVIEERLKSLGQQLRRSTQGPVEGNRL